MSEWYVLDLDADPTPGDPVQTRELAGRLLGQASLAERNTDRLSGVASNGGDLRMEGDYAPQFIEVLGELPGELAKLGRAYRHCGDALNTYASSLTEAKSKSGTALRQGRDAHDRYQGALTELRSLLPPERHAVLASGLNLNELALRAAMVGLDEGVQTQVELVARRARSALDDRALARRLADDAAELRGDAEQRCADAIDDALDGIRNKSWLEKAWDTVSAPFRSWDAFVDLCKAVALVAGVVALFISGPIGWALVAAALVAGAVVFADTAIKYANGEATLGDLAFAALGLIPGAAGAVRLAGLGRAVVGLARNLPSAGRTVLGGLRNARNAIPSIRSGLAGLRQSASTLPNRLVRLVKDPIDVATGEMVLQQTDVDLLGEGPPGALGLVLTRTHLSSYRAGRWFGPSWASTLDQRLEVDGAGVFYAGPDGTLLVYPTPTVDAPVLPEEGPRWPLRRDEDGGYRLHDPASGHTMHFHPAGLEGGEVLPLAAVTDRNGNRIDLDYDPEGVLVAVRHGSGYRIGVDTAEGRVTALRLLPPDADPGGGGEAVGSVDGTAEGTVLVRYGYDAAGRLTEVVNSSGLPLRFAYDAAGRITGWDDRNGSNYRYGYDASGRCVRTAGSDGCLDSVLTYEAGGGEGGRDAAAGGVVTVTDSLGHATVYRVNDHVQMVATTDPLGHTTTFEWDAFDRPLRTTDPLGRVTSWRYDDTGNVTEVTLPDGSRTLADYDDLGQPVTITDPDGSVWRRAYDERGNLTALIDPAGSTIAFSHDERGHLVAVTDALGNTHRTENDAAGQPVATTDPLGATSRFDRDAFGRIVAVTDPLGAVTRLSWTVEGKLAARVLPDGGTERWAYDGEGNLVEYVDPLGQTTRTDVTHFDLPAVRTGPDGARLAFSYDTELRLVAVTNPRGLVWRYTYDAAGRLVRETDFGGRTVDYRHDAAGQLVERVNGAGERTSYGYDPLGNVVERRAGEAVATFAYDPAGRLLRAANPDATIELRRDRLGRVVAETRDGRTITSAYDPAGRRVRRRTPSGAESRWSYDASNRPVTLETAAGSLRFGYDPAGREVERHLDGGAVLAQDWDERSRPRAQALAAAPAASGTAGEARPLWRRSFTYRADGYLTGVDDGAGGDRRLELDPAGRVTSVEGTGWSERYAYDLAGDVTDAAWPAPQEPTSPEAAGRGQRSYDGVTLRRAGGLRYEHDGQGRVVLREYTGPEGTPRAWRYTWDADDRLVAVLTPDGERWRYRYDPLGRRIGKQRLAGDGATVVESVDFTWDDVVLAEQTLTGPAGDAAGGPTTTWDWAPDGFRPLAQTLRAGPRDASQAWVDERFDAIVTDLVGTPTELVDPDGTLAWQARTTLWGARLPGGPDEVDCPLRFPGQYHDPETGLDYNYLRYYDSVAGRYASADAAGLSAGIKTHGYVDNPLRWTDPLGLAPCDPRRLPGVASGGGGLRDVSGRWLRGSHGNAGRVPGQIARQLEGQSFKNFDEFREAFWRAVSGDSNLASQFNAGSVARMANGNSPFAAVSQQVGSHQVYQLHHILPIQHGGGVYDLSNILVATPRFHLDVLPRSFHFG